MDSGGLRAVLVQEIDAGRKLEFPLPHCSHSNLENVDDWASQALLVPVSPGPREEHGDGNKHGDAADGVGPAPANSVLYVDQHCDCKEGAGADEEEEPVEEGSHLTLLLVIVLVELVGSEARHTRLEASGTQRNQVEAQVQNV